VRTANPNVDLNTVDVATLPDGIIEDNIRSARAINAQIDQLNQFVLQGKIKDPAGRVRTQLYGGKINIADGLSEAELVFMKALQEDKNAILSEVKKSITSTNTAIENRRLDIAEKNAETDRIEALKKAETGETTTTGNAFDEIGGGEEVKTGSFFSSIGSGGKRGKITDGIVYDPSGKKKTGKVKIPATILPANMVAALKSAGTEILPDEEVELVVVDGQINSVTPEGGSPISRQAMENAQKKFDTESKGAERLKWGRTIDKPLPTNTKKVNIPGL
jgi:hypothetical protein